MRQYLGQLHAGLAALDELEWAAQDFVGVAHLIQLNATRNRLAGPLLKFRFGIEQVDLAGTAILHEVDHGPGRRRKVSRARLKILRKRAGAGLFFMQQTGESEAADAETGAFQESAAVEHGADSS